MGEGVSRETLTLRNRHSDQREESHEEEMKARLTAGYGSAR